MSAFAVVYERSNMPGNLGVFNKVMEQLSHRGPDGSDVFSSGNIMMGHWHFHTTPEEVGERQPLALRGLPFRIVLDGRIDNREELFSKLNMDHAEKESLSDAALILHSYARWGEECFINFVGEFALVIFDEQKNELICVRDHLGDRTLFYAFYGKQLIIASEPWAVVKASEMQPELNEHAVAHYFAMSVPEDGQTFFNNVYELSPAHIMKVNADSQSTRQYWQPDPDKKIRYKTSEEYVRNFCALLEESVRCRMRSTTPVGVLMSGGLDSTSVASLAARMIHPQQLTTISYVYDELPGIDERKYINAIKEYWHTKSIQIVCDNNWAFKDFQNGSCSPNLPEVNPYWLLNMLAYQRTQAEGVRVLMTGMYGDHLYGKRNRWLIDLIADGHFFQAFRSLIQCVRSQGIKRTLRAGYLKQIVLHILHLMGMEKIAASRRKLPGWLTPAAHHRVKESSKKSLDHNYGMISERNAQRCVSEASNASNYEVERRHPYRDRRLIEFMLAIPAYQIHQCLSSKYILRSAMTSKMPDLVRLRKEYTSFMPLYFRGLEHEKKNIQEQVQNPHAEWRKFVQPDWILKRWNIILPPEQDGPHALVLWLCLSYESWHRAFSLAKNMPGNTKVVPA